MTLYLKLANRLAQQIDQGVLLAGERLPGVRSLSQTQGVSPTTVVAAYRELENQGYIEPKPRSGFYVSARPAPLPEPATTDPKLRPSKVSSRDLLLEMVRLFKRPNVVPLGAAIAASDLLPLSLLDKALVGVAKERLLHEHQYELPGVPELRRQLAKRLLQHNTQVDPNEILITSGCQEAVYLSLQSVTKRGDIVALESPTYHGLLQIVESLGLKALEIPTCPREGMSVAALRLALEQWPVKACVLVANFSNPLGSCMSDANKRELCDLAEEYELTVIEDDVYGDLSFSQQRPLPVKSFDRHDRVIYCGSFSKTISAALRVGWVVSGRHLGDISYAKTITNLSASAISQLALVKLLGNGGYDRHLNTMRANLYQSSQRMMEAIGRYFPADTKVTQPSGGLVLWVELPKSVNGAELMHRALEKNISIAPGELFSSKQKYGNCIRLSFAMQWSPKIDRALSTLASLI